MLNLYMTRLEDEPLDNTEETFRAASGLLSLLQCFQGDMHPDFQRDMVLFFCGRFMRLQELRSALLTLHWYIVLLAWSACWIGAGTPISRNWKGRKTAIVGHIW